MPSTLSSSLAGAACFAIAAALAAGAATAQTVEYPRINSGQPLPPGIRRVQTEEEQRAEERRIAEEIRRAEIGDDEYELEQRVKRGLPIDDLREMRLTPILGAYARTLVSFKPRRIAPGGAGEVHVVVVFHRDGGVRGGATFEMKGEPIQGKLRVGGATVSEPSTGVRLPAFKDQPVWEDTAVFTAPVWVDASAEYGKHDVALRIEAELTQGSTGHSLGLGFIDVKAQLEVGDPIPVPGTPVPGPGPETRRPSIERSAPPVEPVAPPEFSEPNPTDDEIDMAADVARPAVDDEVRTEAEAVAIPDDDGSDGGRWSLLTAVGVLVAVVGLLVFARGRSARTA